MKKTFYLFCFLFFFVMTVQAQNLTMKPFRLEGTILNVDTLSEVDIDISPDNSLKTKKVKVVNNKFVVEGLLKHPGSVIIQSGKIHQGYGVWLVNDTIQVDFIVEKSETGSYFLQTKKITGNQEAIDYLNIIHLRNEIAITSKGIKKETTICQELEKYVDNHKDSYLSLRWLSIELTLQGCDLPKIEELFERLSQEVKNTKEATYFKENILKYKANPIGNLVPNINIPNEKGQLVSLKSLVQGETILSFWASWCPPCRSKHKDMVRYKKLFEDKSMKIIGISLDDDKKKWLNAIQKDGIGWWSHVSELKGGFNSVAAQMFKINSVPYMLLVDKNMRIKANNYQDIMLYLKQK